MRVGLQVVAACAALVLCADPILYADQPESVNPTGPPTQRAANDAPRQTVSVQLPEEAPRFPPGEGAAIANSQCVICHSPDMVLYQPARSADEWKATITKMRTAYGAPLPVEQVDALAAYLANLTAAGK